MFFPSYAVYHCLLKIRFISASEKNSNMKVFLSVEITNRDNLFFQYCNIQKTQSPYSHVLKVLKPRKNMKPWLSHASYRKALGEQNNVGYPFYTSLQIYEYCISYGYIVDGRLWSKQGIIIYICLFIYTRCETCTL